MKLSKRLISLFLVVLLLATLCCQAFAVSGTTSGKSNKYGGNSSTFYVTTSKSIFSHSVKLSFGKGSLAFDGGLWAKEYYGFWTVTVYTKSGSSWAQYSKNNVKDKSSYTVSLPKNAECKIVVYAWKTSTIGQNVSVLYGSDRSSAYWEKLPTWTLSSKTRCS